MNRTRIRHGLRIATSAICLLICGLLIVLWLRSYHTRDKLFGGFPGILFAADSLRGELGIVVFAESLENTRGQNWEMRSDPVDRFSDEAAFDRVTTLPIISVLGFRWSFFQYGLNLIVPHWFFVLLATLPFIVRALRGPYRFSLRTLLIGMTIAAMVCGAIAMML